MLRRNMVCDFMQMIAVQMYKRPADRAFQMKMIMAGSGFCLCPRILPAGTSAVVKGIAPDKSLCLELFELPVDRR